MRPLLAMKLLVTDIDGTLLDAQGRLPPANVEALQQWVDRGGVLALATGRNLTITRPIAQAIDRDLFLILQDGALLMPYPSGAVLAWHNLEQSIAQSACDILLNEGLSALAFAPLPNGQHFDVLPSGGNTLSPGLRACLRAKSGQFCRRNKAYRLLAASSKIVTIDSQGKTDAAYYRLKRHLPQARVIRTEARGLDAWFMEAGSPRASKMQGLQTLLQYLRLSFAEVIAVGDAENDVEILQLAGLGVAMANASERVKAVANLVIKSNSEDGLARFLKDEG
ncbi:MAG TPA: HAD family hydrolase [Chloroflexi bacterium]|nr:MAG: hypothetical protein B6I38_09240 [Anaerolineaceae bacterium 4572_5.1]HEY85526.1 HAD family hydrolase [Chloroflexota bacterium]